MLLPRAGQAGREGGNRQPPLSEARGDIVLFPLCVCVHEFV